MENQHKIALELLINWLEKRHKSYENIWFERRKQDAERKFISGELHAMGSTLALLGGYCAALERNVDLRQFLKDDMSCNPAFVLEAENSNLRQTVVELEQQLDSAIDFLQDVASMVGDRPDSEVLEYIEECVKRLKL